MGVTVVNTKKSKKEYCFKEFIIKIEKDSKRLTPMKNTALLCLIHFIGLIISAMFLFFMVGLTF